MKPATAILKECEHLRQNYGYLPLDSWCLISGEGKDLLNYLQTQSTNDVHQMQVGQGQASAIVDRKARIIATFSLHKIQQTAVLILVESCQREALLKHLETYLFREDARFTLPPPGHTDCTGALKSAGPGKYFRAASGRKTQCRNPAYIR